MKSTPDHLLSAAASDPALVQLCDEIIERLQAGDVVDMASLALEHPEHADQLRRLLPALEALVDLGASAVQHRSGVVSTQGTSDLAPKVLGDYRILREIGRGGMGVVYEAEQRSLNRRVALKVLPMAAALDTRQFQRFQLEAQAAACLHHNNIVPVFAVGTEGGVPFYAMQYIEGRSLAQVIHELRRAEGLDLEPLAPEAETAPRLADLSTTALARSLVSGQAAAPQADAPGPDSLTEAYRPNANPAPGPGEARNGGEPDANPAIHVATKSGSSTRTRDYSRNIAGLGLQAAEALDHAHTRGILHRDIKPANLLLDAEGRLWVTDFGLAQIQGNHGLTLSGDILGTLRYMSPEQALAKRVVIDGRTDVYSLGVTLYELLTLQPAFDGKDRAEILHKIESDEPALLRKVNASVPQDLETIIHKALAKEPSERYGSAKELADDLRYHLDDRPIRARRPSLLDRAAKWGRRHRAGVAAASVILVLAMIGLATSTILIAREQRRTSAALEQAEARFQFARRAVDAMYSRVAERWLAEQPRMKPLQREFLQEALRYYQEFARRRSLTLDERAEAATAYQRVGRIQSELGQTTEARSAYDQATSLLRRLVDERPDSAEFRKLLSGALDGHSSLAWKLGDLMNAERLAREAITHRRRLVERFPELPEYAPLFAESQGHLGLVLKDAGRRDEADVEFRQAAARLRQLLNSRSGDPDLARKISALDNNHALLLEEMGGLGDAEEALRESLRLLESVVTAAPDRPNDRLGLAYRHINLGNLLLQTGRPADAEAEFRPAIGHLDRLAREFADVPDHRRDLARAYAGLAGALGAQGQLVLAEEALTTCLALREAVVRDFPDRADFRQELATALNAQGIAYARSRRLVDAEAAFHRAIALGEGLVASFPDRVVYRDALAGFLNSLGLVLNSLGRDAEAEPLLRRAVSLYEQSGNTVHLATALSSLGIVLRALGQLDEAATSYLRSREVWTQLLANAGRPADIHHSLGGVLNNLANVYKDKRELAEARELFQEAIAHQRGALKDSPSNPTFRLFLRNHYSGLGETVAQLGDHQALARLVGEMRAALPESGQIPAIAAGNLIDVLPFVERDTSLTSERRRVVAESYIALIRDLIDQAGRLGAKDPKAQYLLAQILADAPDARFRDRSRAVSLARSATQNAPQDPYGWTTLGLACYRAGAIAEATDALKRAMELKLGGDPNQWLILAMTAHARGDTAEARRLHEQSLEWLKKHPVVHQDLSRLHDESARVLGIKPAPSNADQQPPKEPATKPR